MLSESNQVRIENSNWVGLIFNRFTLEMKIFFRSDLDWFGLVWTQISEWFGIFRICSKWNPKLNFNSVRINPITDWKFNLDKSEDSFGLKIWLDFIRMKLSPTRINFQLICIKRDWKLSPDRYGIKSDLYSTDLEQTRLKNFSGLIRISSDTDYEMIRSSSKGFRMNSCSKLKFKSSSDWKFDRSIWGFGLKIWFEFNRIEISNWVWLIFNRFASNFFQIGSNWHRNIFRNTLVPHCGTPCTSSHLTLDFVVPFPLSLPSRQTKDILGQTRAGWRSRISSVTHLCSLTNMYHGTPS